MSVGLLTLANRERKNPGTASPYELWRIAEGASRSESERRHHYRHAAIHAGYLIDAGTGLAYDLCPVCRDVLA